MAGPVPRRRRDPVTGRFPDAPPRVQAALTQTAEEILAEVSVLSRRPARMLLARLLACAPDDAALHEHATKLPDRWMQCVAIAGRLAGYSERLEIEGDLNVHAFQQMSDAELIERCRAATASFAAMERDLAGLPALPEAPAPEATAE